MIKLENEYLQVEIQEHGAEIKSVLDVQTNIEYIWQADPEYWGRSTPILFPIVGKLTDDSVLVDGASYSMGQHGFARDMAFNCVEQTEAKAIFELLATEETRKKYPFEFKLRIHYTLIEREVLIQWEVFNPATEVKLPFSIGAHPAFNTTLFDADHIEDYYFEFDREIDFNAWKLNEHGRFGDEVVHLGKSDSLRLSPELFEHDALVFKTIDFQRISLKNMRNVHGLTMYLQNFTFKDEKPLIGLWSPYKTGGNLPFVCIEPWFGHADTEGGPFNIYQKPGIIVLEPEETFTTEYAIEFY